MNKIDEIKQAYAKADNAGLWIGEVYTKSQVDEWLHYLIGEVEHWKKGYETLMKLDEKGFVENEELRKENEALRKALEEIIKQCDSEPYNTKFIVEPLEEIARKVLRV